MVHVLGVFCHSEGMDYVIVWRNGSGTNINHGAGGNSLPHPWLATMEGDSVV